jgi:hypothetical protein
MPSPFFTGALGGLAMLVSWLARARRPDWRKRWRHDPFGRQMPGSKLDFLAVLFAFLFCNVLLMATFGDQGLHLLKVMWYVGAGSSCIISLFLLPPASRTFATERRTGTLESLLLTPFPREALLMNRAGITLNVALLYAGLTCPVYIISSIAAWMSGASPAFGLFAFSAWATSSSLCLSVVIHASVDAVHYPGRAHVMLRGCWCIFRNCLLLAIASRALHYVLPPDVNYPPESLAAAVALAGVFAAIPGVLILARAFHALHKTALHLDELLLEKE